MYEEIFTFLAILAGLIVILGAVVFNGVVRLKNDVDKAWSNIDVLLKQRYDEIPNVVSTVMGYMEHERGTLEGIVKLRSMASGERGIARLAAENSVLSESLRSLFASAEAYPGLRAQEGFLKLQARLSELESQIADRRAFYNEIATNYNTRIGSYPGIIVARIIGMRRIELFSATDEEKKKVEVGL